MDAKRLWRVGLALPILALGFPMTGWASPLVGALLVGLAFLVGIPAIWPRTNQLVIRSPFAISGGPASPPPAPVLTRPATVSAEERESIHRMRVFWRQYGHHAAHAMLDLYEEVTRKLANELWWAALLRGSVGGYLEATDLMLKAVDGSPDITLTDVIDRFNRFYQAYVIHAAWLNRLDQHNVLKLAAEPHRESYQRWRAVNTAFRRELKSLKEWPEYQGRLKPDVPFSPETARFLDDEPSIG
jgi:hypothetical protein